MGEAVGIQAADGHEFQAWQERPEGAVCGAVIVIQEMFGVDDFVKGAAARYAADGYLALAPALYDRQRRGFVATREQMDEAKALRAAFNWDQGTMDVDSCRKAALDAGAGKVGIVGYCFGGTVSFLACCDLPMNAGVSYYGTSTHEFIERRLTCPYLMHFGGSDRNIPLERVDLLKRAYPDTPIHVYAGAGHGFSNVSRPAFDPFAHDVALMRTAALFHSHLR